MKNKAAFAALSFALAVSTGCVTAPTQQQYEHKVALLGYGDELPSDWKERVQAFMTLRLKDADSAIWQFEGVPFQGWAGENDRNGTRVAAGYVVTSLVNAKNGFGGYTGFEKYQFIIRDGRVIAVSHQGRTWQLI